MGRKKVLVILSVLQEPFSLYELRQEGHRDEEAQRLERWKISWGLEEEVWQTVPEWSDWRVEAGWAEWSARAMAVKPGSWG